MLDPRINAVRPDLADVRLAAYVFAPHYAAPLHRQISEATSLTLARDPASETLVALSPGDAFDVLEFAGTLAWGTAPATGFVGYVPTAALVVPA